MIQILYRNCLDNIDNAYLQDVEVENPKVREKPQGRDIFARTPIYRAGKTWKKHKENV
jgi:hypothetical protein